MLIPQWSVNVYKFLQNYTVILVYVSFIFRLSSFTIPVARLLHYKSGVPSVAGVVEHIGQFKGYIVSVKKAITLFNFLVRTGEGLSMNRCCNMYVGQESNSSRWLVIASNSNISVVWRRVLKTINQSTHNDLQAMYTATNVSMCFRRVLITLLLPPKIFHPLLSIWIA